MEHVVLEEVIEAVVEKHFVLREDDKALGDMLLGAQPADV